MFNLNYGIYFGDPAANGLPFQFSYTTNGGTNFLFSPSSPSGPSDVANATSSKVFTKQIQTLDQEDGVSDNSEDLEHLKVCMQTQLHLQM